MRIQRHGPMNPAITDVRNMEGSRSVMESSERAIFSRVAGRSGHRLDVGVLKEPAGYRLKIESDGNEVGVLFRLAAVLYCHNWSVMEAKISTPERTLISDEFLIRAGAAGQELDEGALKMMIDDLERLLFDGVSVLGYLTEHAREAPRPEIGYGEGQVFIRDLDEEVVIEVRGQDKSGLLLALSQAFYLMDISIMEASIFTDEKAQVHNLFLIDRSDIRFRNREFRTRLTEELRYLI
ncbi:MAG TPA: hypothetical protein DEA96_12330 [Leptospiraceae bacterium]|nr:hypothetical protein [Spirochaetaceae bacterium]HBS05748.1 hypothetical protein [Leptospiraceae bacterium]